MGIMEMSDAQINLAIAKIEYPDKEVGSLDNGSAFVVYHPTSGVKNYIKYWGDIGPIIEREKIDIRYSLRQETDWSAVSYDEHDSQVYEGVATTPTKAAALCYLKMKGLW